MKAAQQTAENKVEGAMSQRKTGDAGWARWLRWALLVLLLCLPERSWAEPELQVLKADLSSVTQEAVAQAEQKATMRLYFSARDSETGSPLEVSEKILTVKLKRDSAEVPATVSSTSLKEFTDGKLSVAVMVVFPNGSVHEGEKIGDAIGELLVGKLRQSDEVGAIGYGNNFDESEKFKLSKDKAKAYSQSIKSALPVNDDQSQPNVHDAVINAVEDLKTSKADLKYLIVISDGQGKTKKDNAAQAQEARDAILASGIRPFVIMYWTKFQKKEDHYKQTVQDLVGGGYFIEAKNEKEYRAAIEKALGHVYSQHHVLEVVFDLNEKWIKEGKVGIELDAKFADGSKSASISGEWPKLSQSYMWILWWTLGILGVIGLIVLIVVLVKRYRDRPKPVGEPVFVGEDAPEDVFCEVCGKKIPETLYGFSGEFCLERGKAGCPYYQPPDRGRLMITKGELSGATFFIKEEITTIGSLVSEDTLVLLKDQTVSKKHAAIKVDEGNRYELRDFSSTNGTRVNGEFIQRKFLKDGDRLNFGEVEVEFTLK
jgi:hypothetical protein